MRFSPVIKIIFGRSVETGKLPMDLVSGLCDPSVQKGRQNTGCKLPSDIPYLHTLQGPRAHRGLPDSETHEWTQSLVWPPTWLSRKEVMRDPINNARRGPCEEC